MKTGANSLLSTKSSHKNCFKNKGKYFILQKNKILSWQKPVLFAIGSMR